MNRQIWVNEGGRVECSDHIGVEARAVLARCVGTPRFIHTPLDVWLLLDRDDFFGGCETCGGRMSSAQRFGDGAS